MRILALVLLLLAAPVAAQVPVGRVAETSGPLSSRGPGGGFVPAGRGAALAEGQTLRTGARAQAELDLGANRVGMDPDTVLRIDSAHPATPAFTLQQGRAMLLLRSLQPGQVGRVDLPGGSVTLAQPGLYTVQAPEPGQAGSVGVSRGMAQVFGAGVSLMVPAGQTALFGGGQPARLQGWVAEGFLADDPGAPPVPQVVYPPPVAVARPVAAAPPGLAEMPGAEPLLREGSWVATPDYGSVWYPPVAPGWSPYAGGWGGASWGQVPWSLGAWIMIGPRWAWLPPPHRHYRPPPAYARGLPPPGAGLAHRPPVVAPMPPPPRPMPPPVVTAPPPMANPTPAAPHIFAPRPAAPMIAAPPVAGPPPRPAAPPRSCPPGRPFC